MNTMLRYAQQEVRKLKHKQDDRLGAVIELILDFSRSEEEITRLVGYSAFKEQLDALPLPHDRNSIKRACELSHFSYENFFDDTDSTENISIPIHCSKEQARIVNYRLRGDF